MTSQPPPPTLDEAATGKTSTTTGKRASTQLLSGPFFAVRTSTNLQRPAIFLGVEDLQTVVGSDGTADHRSFETLEEIQPWLSELPTPKGRKRKSTSLLPSSNRSINPRQEHNNQKWEEKYEELVRFTETIGDGDPNLALSKEYRQPELADFLRHQRQDYSSFLSNKVPENSTVDRKTRYFRLLQLGVRLQPDRTYDWPQQAKKWHAYMEANPNAELTEISIDPEVVELARWQQQQIEQYIKMIRKETPHEMYPHRLQKLKEWNFPFPKDVAAPKKVLKTFDERLEEFIQWKEAKNSALVPQSVRGLGEWVKEQRKEYRKFAKGEKAYITAERVEKLRAAGFVFDVRKKQDTSNGDDLV